MNRSFPGPTRLAAAVAVAAALVVSPDVQAQTYFLQLDGVDSESREDWIALTSVSWATGATPPSRGPGLVVVRKRVDKSTPVIMQYCVTHETLPEVVLHLRDTRGADTPRRLVLENVRLSDCQAATQDMPIESMSFNFTEIRVWDQPPSAMKLDGFLKVPDIPGTSTDPRYPGWIVLQSVEIDRAAAARRRHKPITIIKRIDKASPALSAAHSRRTRFAEATLAVRDASDPVVYLVYKLTNVAVTSYRRSGAAIEQLTIVAEGWEPR
jgi:type VI protein secretion system component Hcp